MNHAFNRREFLGASVAAGAAWTSLGAASLARGADAPSNRIVVGVMGVNGRGSDLVKGFSQSSGVEVAYVCDVDERAVDKGLRAAASQEKRPQGVTDFRRILDDSAVDALLIAAPDHWHAPAAILACAAGKHVYVEKPASHNGREGQLLIAAARKHNRVVQLGTQRRSDAGVAEAVRRVREGVIGRTLFARGWINSTRPSIGHGAEAPVPSYLDYNLWQGPAPEEPYRDNIVHYHWHWFWNWGTGELGNNGIHSLDVCRWGMGVDYPTQVTCGGGKFHFDDDQQTPDTQLATFNFGDRAITWEHRTWHKRGFEDQLFGMTFYGEEGALVIGGAHFKQYDMQGAEVDRGALSGGQSEHFANFLDAIRTGAPLNAEIEEGVKSTTLCHLGNIAYRTGRTVTFDPDRREIVGDDEQRTLWGREYRPGWEPTV